MSDNNPFESVAAQMRVAEYIMIKRSTLLRALVHSDEGIFIHAHALAALDRFTTTVQALPGIVDIVCEQVAYLEYKIHVVGNLSRRDTRKLEAAVALLNADMPPNAKLSYVTYLTKNTYLVKK